MSFARRAGSTKQQNSKWVKPDPSLFCSWKRIMNQSAARMPLLMLKRRVLSFLRSVLGDAVRSNHRLDPHACGNRIHAAAQCGQGRTRVKEFARMGLLQVLFAPRRSCYSLWISRWEISIIKLISTHNCKPCILMRSYSMMSWTRCLRNILRTLNVSNRNIHIILICPKIVGARPHWLETLLKSDITRWDSFQLEPNYTLEQVEKIANRTASLLDLRNYLFSRRARLLSQLQLHEELAKASLVYVSGTFQELSSLTDIKPQFIRTWAVLAGFSAFQLVERADALTSEGHTRITTNGAALLDLARGHLFKLGDALGLAEGVPAIEDIEPLIAGFVSLAVESDQDRPGLEINLIL